MYFTKNGETGPGFVTLQGSLLQVLIRVND